MLQIKKTYIISCKNGNDVSGGYFEQHSEYTGEATALLLQLGQSELFIGLIDLVNDSAPRIVAAPMMENVVEDVAAGELWFWKSRCEDHFGNLAETQTRQDLRNKDRVLPGNSPSPTMHTSLISRPNIDCEGAAPFPYIRL